jgi:hypothetical protein
LEQPRGFRVHHTLAFFSGQKITQGYGQQENASRHHEIREGNTHKSENPWAGGKEYQRHRRICNKELKDESFFWAILSARVNPL